MKETRRAILRIALPSMGSSVFNMLYSIVDLAWIGRLGKEAVASVALAASLYNMNFVLNEIFGVSSMVMLSRRWGEKNKVDFERISQQIVMYKFLSGALLLAITYLLAPYFLSWLGSGKIPPGSAIIYYRLMAIFLPFSFLLGTMMTIYRSIGDTKTLFYITAAGSIANIFLDPLLIFNLKMGVAGSALASGICEVLVVITGYVILGKLWKVRALRPSKIDLSILKKILMIGSPSLADSLNWNLSRMIVVRIFSGYGVLATATFGIFTRIIDITWMIGFALEGAITTLVGQSLGMMRKDKARDVLNEGKNIAIVIGAVVTLTVFLLSHPISDMFSNDPKLIESSSNFLRSTSFGFFFMYLMNVAYGTLTGGGRTIDAFYIGLISNWGFRIPTMILLKELGLGYNALGIVVSLSIALGSVVGFLMIKNEKWLSMKI